MLDRIVSSLGADLAFDVRYRGGRADRLIDRMHASIVEVVVRSLQRAGWTTVVEFSFSVYGERGSVDVLGWHAATRTLLIVEVKSRFTDLQEMLLSLGRKLRLVPEEARRELGWDALAVGRIVVVPGTTESRSIVKRHTATFASTLPATSESIKHWIRKPEGPMSGIWFLSRDVLSRKAKRSPSH